MFVRRLAASGIAIGLGALARPGMTRIARAQASADVVVRVRVGEVVQSGTDFRAGLPEGVRLPGVGGDARSITAQQPGARFTSEPIPIDFACSHIGVHWQTDDGWEREQGLQVDVRSGPDGSIWSPWRRVRVESHGRARAEGYAGGGGETFGALLGGRLGRWLQYRLTFADAGPDAAAVRRVALTYLDARGPSSGQAGANVPGPAMGSKVFLGRVITREGWGADESIRFVDGQDQWPRAFVPPKLLVVHHTATDNEQADPAAEVRAIYTYHTVTQGFGDIGYQLLIDNRGQAYEGRRGRESDAGTGTTREVLSRDVVAGHVVGYNYGSVGIALLGTFTEAEPSASALQTLEEALAFEATRHQLDPTGHISFLRARSRSGEDALWRDDLPLVSGHRDCIATECPGDRLYARLPALRDQVATRLGPPGPRARITHAPTDHSVWPTDLVFGWEGAAGAVEFSTRLEGWQLSDEPDRVVPLSGYGTDERPTWSAWSRESTASFPLLPDARGSYTLQVRARAQDGHEGLFAAHWPLFVDRHVLVDNADHGRTTRQGSWQRSRNVLEFNGVDYEVAESADASVVFIWTLNVPQDGTYRVLACWTEGSDRASNARFTIFAGGHQLAAVNMTQRERGGRWVELAQVPLVAGTPCRVELTSLPDGVVVADALRIVLT